MSTKTISPYFKENAGNIASAGVSAASLVGDWVGMANEGLGLEGSEPQAMPGKPYYAGGDFYNRAYGSRARDSSGGELLAGGLKGAAIGTAINPGIGTVVGGTIGLVGTAIAGDKRQARQVNERNEALAQASTYQGRYNEAAASYTAQQVGDADYRRRLRNYNRFNSLDT